VTLVGVNLLWLRPGEVGGSEEYTLRTLSAFIGAQDLGREFDLKAFSLSSFPPAHPALAAALDTAPAPFVTGRRRAARVVAENTWLAARVRADGCDLVHFAGGTTPAVRTKPALLTVHDLQYLALPELFSPVKLAYLRASVPRSVRHARVITVPSEFVRTTVIDAFGVDPARVVVVPHGLPPAEGSGTPPEDVLRARYGLPGRVVLYPAMTHPHKGHVVLIEALEPLATREPDLRLVLIGGAGAAEQCVADTIAGTRRPFVVRPGRVPDSDRDGLLALASCLAFPSRYEGFGAPVIEAMAAGCPVVAADATALREVVADAGVLVAPEDVAAWTKAIADVLDDDARHRSLAAAGRIRATLFTGEVSARALAAAYRLALASPPQSTSRP
jgi:alpha-1,3-rhamnosyl/mannosyltransferase